MSDEEKGKIILEFFRVVRGAGMTHIMTGDFYIAYGRSLSAKTIEIDFRADTPEEAAQGALEQWKKIKTTGN